jgi:hypothetical protein
MPRHRVGVSQSEGSVRVAQPMICCDQGGYESGSSGAPEARTKHSRWYGKMRESVVSERPETLHSRRGCQGINLRG